MKNRLSLTICQHLMSYFNLEHRTFIAAKWQESKSSIAVRKAFRQLSRQEALWISALQVSFRWSCSWGMLACNRDSQRSPVPNLRDTSYSRCPLISTKGQAALLGSIPGSVLFHLSLNHSYTATCCLQLDGRYQLVGIQHLLVNPSGGDPDKN